MHTKTKLILAEWFMYLAVGSLVVSLLFTVLWVFSQKTTLEIVIKKSVPVHVIAPCAEGYKE